MPRNFWSFFKQPFEAVGSFVSEIAYDVEQEAVKVIDVVVQHPLESAGILGTAILGGAAIVLTGGAAAPLVAEAEAIELAALGGAAVVAEVGVGAGAAAAVAGTEIELAALGASAAVEAEAAVGVGAAVGAESGLGAVAGTEIELAALGDSAIAEAASGEAAAVVEAEAAGVGIGVEGEVSEFEMQEMIDDHFGSGVVNVSEVGIDEAVNQGVLRDPSFLSTIAQKGGKFVKLIGSVRQEIGLAVGIGTGIGSMIENAKSITATEKTGDKIKKVGEIIKQVNDIQSQFSGKEIEELKEIGNAVEKVGDFVHQVDDGIDAINQLTKKEISIDKNNNEQLKEIVSQNRGETAAIKHSQVILDAELRQIVDEEVMVNDNIARVATTLDRPRNVSDFLKDIQTFQSSQSKIDYVAENYRTFVNFNQFDMNSVLSTLNRTVRVF